MSKIYIAGPMQGYKDFNFPAFAEATKMFRDLGWEVFSPAEKDIEKHGAGIEKSETGNLAEANAKGFSLRDALAVDLEWIALHADAVYMLKGWERSYGATAEHSLAKALIPVGMEIYYQ